MKPCPFCAEQIQDAAIKCRFCGSLLEEPPATAASPTALAATPSAAMGTPKILYEGTPSWKAWFWSYVAAGVLSLVLVGLVWLGILQWKRKSLHYKITERTIDYETGVLTRRIETLQLWRVQDIDFRQSLFERMLGIARIHVFTHDKTDPELVLRGLPASRDVFEGLKNAAELARQQRVLGLVQ